MFGLVRKALFTASPEKAHELALEGLKASHAVGASSLIQRAETFKVSAMGLDFANPVGLAAGMDKNGDYIDALGSLGFGFIEVGTVTPRPQPGNPKPRVFRLPEAGAMINRLGFNNKGVDHLVSRVCKRQYPGILGINIGKNFDTPNDRAVDDYLICLGKVYAHADYITVNISSPNTKGLRDLQDGEALENLLGALAEDREKLAQEHGKRVPIAVKVAPDLEAAAIPGLAQAVVNSGMDAVIATNTTIERPGVGHLDDASQTGGLSGRPLLEKANEVLSAFRFNLPPTTALIGVGGISAGSDAARKIELGADLVQFYTGFVYEGPGLIPASVRAIRESASA